MKNNVILTYMRYCLIACMLVFSVSMTEGQAEASECPRVTCKDHTQKIGEKLVCSFWKSVERQDIQAYSNAIDDTFQGLNQGGIYNREDQIMGLSGLTVTAFELQNLKAARHGKSLVISYDFYALGEGIVSGPSIDVWHDTCEGWKLISHAYVPF